MSNNDDSRAVVKEGDDRATTEVGSCVAEFSKGKVMSEVAVGEDGRPWPRSKMAVQQPTLGQGGQQGHSQGQGQQSHGCFLQQGAGKGRLRQGDLHCILFVPLVGQTTCLG